MEGGVSPLTPDDDPHDLEEEEDPEGEDWVSLPVTQRAVGVGVGKDVDNAVLNCSRKRTHKRALVTATKGKASRGGRGKARPTAWAVAGSKQTHSSHGTGAGAGTGESSARRTQKRNRLPSHCEKNPHNSEEEEGEGEQEDFGNGVAGGGRGARSGAEPRSCDPRDRPKAATPDPDLGSDHAAGTDRYGVRGPAETHHQHAEEDEQPLPMDQGQRTHSASRQTHCPTSQQTQSTRKSTRTSKRL